MTGFGVKPPLDPCFVPLAGVLSRAGQTGEKAAVTVHRPGGVDTVTFGVQSAADPTEADKVLAAAIFKSALWIYGGHSAVIRGSEPLFEHLCGLGDGELSFDIKFMSDVYRVPFEMSPGSLDSKPKTARTRGPGFSQGLGFSRGIKGCVIGFDAGGSDIKVSAVIDGDVVFSEEIVWHPKLNADPAYHYGHIVAAMKLAASKMPRVDGIGVSSAGIYADNMTKAASLFIKVAKPDFDRCVRDIYIRAAAELGSPPLVVANDGDVAALAGAMEYGEGGVLGIAMGTSEAGGYIDTQGNITGRLNELAFVPVDANPNAPLDEWSGDKGRGSAYLSQDAVARLARAAGIAIEDTLTPAEKLSCVQGLMKNGDARAAAVYESIGVYLGHALAWYSLFYDIRHVPLMGRVVSGEGGVIIQSGALKTLEGYPEVYEKITIRLPDEKSRRVGQAVAAASLPLK